MLVSIVRTMIRQRLLVLVVALALCVAGMFAAEDLSVDAFPDVTNIQVQVATVAVGRSPEEDRAAGHGPGGNRNDGASWTGRDALHEQKRTVPHYTGIYR